MGGVAFVESPLMDQMFCDYDSVGRTKMRHGS